MTVLLLATLALGSVPRSHVERLAIVAGNNYAVGEQTPLHHAEDDAARMAAVLEDVGGVKPGDLFLLRGLGLADVQAAFARARRRALARHRLRERTLLVFYFSGHSDGLALELGPDRLTFGDLRRLLDQSGADVRLAIIDSCRSGALLAEKGTRPGPAFDIRLSDASTAEGTAFLTSSAADEEALESKELGGSFFTHHLVSGLRGAADSSGDGLVTLGEAYRYAYANTVAATADTLPGAQHPAYDYRLTGIGEIVLTEPGRSAASLAFPAGFERALVTRPDEIVAEVPAGAAGRLGLPPATYQVSLWRGDRRYGASVRLAAGQHLALAWSDLTRAPMAAFASAKGAASGASGQRELDQAISEFESFHDERAARALRELLARHPSSAIVARAHLYLGLILFNQSRSDAAREEFKQAMEADPGIELPVDVSPKARLAFAEARQQLSREIEAAPPAAPASPPSPGPTVLVMAPPAATSPPTAEIHAQAPHRSHWLAWTLGAVGVAAGAVAVYGGAEVLSYDSIANGPPLQRSAGDLNATNGQFWSVGWIVAAAVGAASLAAAPFTW
jgi:tetratricopeptide (TPR) repeat protein